MSKELYDGRTRDEWREELTPQEDWVVRHFLCAIALLGKPKSLLDVGCGFGAIVSLSRSLTIQAYGVDQLILKTGGNYVHHNLVEKYNHFEKAEMVWCTEVAEHLDPSAHATLCDTLADNLALHGTLVFSAAHPNQGGNGHVAERPAKYWLDQFSLRQLNYRKDLTVNLALLWSNINSPLFWMAENVLLFEK